MFALLDVVFINWEDKSYHFLFGSHLFSFRTIGAQELISCSRRVAGDEPWRYI